MQYIRVGRVKIPYEIKQVNNKKIFRVYGIRIPFSVYETDEGQKYYRIFGLRFRLRFKDKIFVTRRQLNFQNREVWTENDIRRVSEEIFREKLGYAPDLENPRSLNEKIFWMKLNYHNPLVTRCCDKFTVKEYVTEKLGDGFVVPVIDSWQSAEDIDFDALPDQFVLKVNWSSGYNIIVKDKSQLDVKAAKRKISHWLEPQQNSYYQTFNWGYKHMKPVVYAEEYIEQMDGQLYDYKFYCCNGKAEFLFIATDRFNGEGVTYDFFNIDFERMDLHYGGRAHSSNKLEKPRFYNEMIKYAEILSKPFPFVRIDFYEQEDRIYVGEMTFYSGGGILPFDPIEWDYKLGEYINLPLQKGTSEDAVIL